MSELDDFLKRHETFDPTSTIDIAFLVSIGIKDRSWASEFKSWSSDRKRIALEQIFYRSKGIDSGDIDGYAGSQTQYARTVYAARQNGDTTVETWRDNETRKTAPKFNSPYERDVPKFYGNVGENQVSCPLPYPLIIAWNTSQRVNSFQCHKLVKEPMQRIFNRTLEQYGLDRISQLKLNYFGGSLMVRKKRGSSSWSMHSWGIAVDLDPEQNQLKMNKTQALFAKPEYDKFWEIVYDEGAIGLGKERDYDWMHFQFAKL